jgi:hypothetical protein
LSTDAFEFTPAMLDPLLRSFSILCSVPVTPETRLALQSYLSLFNSLLQKYRDNPEYLPRFATLFSIAEALLSVPSDSEICCLALRVIAVVIGQPHFSCPDPAGLLLKFAPLTARLQTREALYAALLALVKRVSMEETASVAVIRFLPTLFLAISAYYNVQPFSGLVSDADIRIIFGCGFLLADTDDVPQEVAALVTDTLQDPAKCFPEDFVLQACIMLSSAKGDAVRSGARHLVKIAQAASEEYLSAVMFVCACFLEAPACSQAQIDAFAPLALIAAKDFSPEAARVLGFFVRRSQGTLTIPAFGLGDGSERGWEEVSEKTREIAKELPALAFQKGKVRELLPIPMVPLTESGWACEEVKVIRKGLSKIRVEPLTHMERVWAPVREHQLEDDMQPEIAIPEQSSEFLFYLNFLKE